MDIVGAYACSHAGLIVTRRDNAPERQRRNVYAAFEQMREAISRARPDAIVLVATDHMRVFPLPGVPMFAIGVGPVARGLGDAGIEACQVPIHQDFAREVLRGCIESDVDMVFCEEVSIDHSFVTPLTFITPHFDIPIVPIMQNCNVPPRPTFRRSHSVGRTIREAILAGPPGRAVVVGTGGLSHWVGSAERIEFMNSPAGTRWTRIKEHPVEIADVGPINEVFDRSLLNALGEGRVVPFLEEWTPERVEEEAGNGAQEIRNWILAAGVAADAPTETMAYEPVAEWLTGTAVACFQLS